MNDFWLGVIAGCSAALIFATCALFIHENRVQNVERRVQQLEAMQERVEEHERIMRAYEFFNEKWTAQMIGEE